MVIILLALFILGIFAVYTIMSFMPENADKYVKVCEDNDIACHETGLPYQNPALPVDDRVKDLLGRMTTAEKIGQMALVEKNSVKNLDDIAKYGLGAMMSGSGAKPDDNTPTGWLKMINEFKARGKKTRLAIPLLYGVDANHGNSNVPGATIFPHFIGLGAANDPEIVKAIGKATAEESAATGVEWIFSPDLDIATDARWGRTYETFGSNAETVSKLGSAYLEGINLFNQAGFKIAGSAKHYVANGATEWNSSINKDYHLDQGNAKISNEGLKNIHLPPFAAAVKADSRAIMVALNKINGEKTAFNKYLITDVLKNQLEFKGFVFSDWYGVYEKEFSKYQALVKAVNAGVDMIMLPFDYKNFSDYMRRALARGDIKEERLNEAAGRILKVKFEIGLFDAPENNGQLISLFGSKEHKELARQAVRKSLVLLKNNDVLPLKKDVSKILVAGSAADNLGRQCGGWTIEWQGIDGNWIPGATILKGIKDAVPATRVEYNKNGDFSGDNSADIGIAVAGEKPYAEGWGDNENPSLTSEDLTAINNLKKHSKKIIVIIISGRPLNIKEQVKNWDAIIAAWLPGSEGQGVADALFGDYLLQGKLPVKWEL